MIIIGTASRRSSNRIVGQRFDSDNGIFYCWAVRRRLWVIVDRPIYWVSVIVDKMPVLVW